MVLPALGDQLSQGRPALAIPGDALALVLADRAALGRRVARRVLDAASSADKRLHPQSSRLPMVPRHTLCRAATRVSPPGLASCKHPSCGSRPMFTSGGGGGGLPRIDSPFEALIVLLFFAIIIWLIARF